MDMFQGPKTCAMRLRLDLQSTKHHSPHAIHVGMKAIRLGTSEVLVSIATTGPTMLKQNRQHGNLKEKVISTLSWRNLVLEKDP